MVVGEIPYLIPGCIRYGILCGYSGGIPGRNQDGDLGGIPGGNPGRMPGGIPGVTPGLIFG